MEPTRDANPTTGQTPDAGRVWPRTQPLNPAEAVRLLAERTGIRLVVEGLCGGGEVGAAYVRWPDGRRSVLTSGNPRAAELVSVALAAGLPAARYELVADIDTHPDSTYVVVQELLPGAAPVVVDRALIEAMLVLNGRMAGLLRTRPDLPSVGLHLRSAGPGYCLHEPLARYNRVSARLLDWIHEVGQDRDTADGPDLVHMDYHVGNILVRDGQISALVDWDGAGRGDRLLDLVTLRFDLARRAPDLCDWLDNVLKHTVPADRLRAYWAHMSLRQVDWAIRHHTSAEVELWLAIANSYGAGSIQIRTVPS